MSVDHRHLLRDLYDWRCCSYVVMGGSPAWQRGLMRVEYLRTDLRHGEAMLLLDWKDRSACLGSNDNLQSSEEEPSGRKVRLCRDPSCGSVLSSADQRQPVEHTGRARKDVCSTQPNPQRSFSAPVPMWRGGTRTPGRKSSLDTSAVINGHR